MRRVIYVISDLHLGGADALATQKAFQMCPAPTRALLSDFIDRIPKSSKDTEVHLVIAGDIVDFLAEAPFQPFTVDPAVACAKLARIFESTRNVWDSLSRFAGERGGILTLMLGNHDIELSLPGVRKALLDRVGGPRVRFLYDNEAFSIGPLLIEHGNRFDAWNAVPHGALRRVRSQLSRRLPVIPDFPALPGSRMVIDVINPLKIDYPFIDLLKPETAAALPIAAALGGVGLKDAWRAFARFRDSWAVDYDEATGEPTDQNLISGAADTDQALWEIAQTIQVGGRAEQVSALGDTLQALGTTVRAARIDALYSAFRSLKKFQRLHREAFDIEHEVDTYLTPARRSAEAGYQVVIYGHTHLPKRVPLGHREDGLPLYLNTGTWADVMCVPAGIWNEDEPAGRDLFRQFVADLDGIGHDGWRRSMPTYARVELDGDALCLAELRFADDEALVSTQQVLARLASTRSTSPLSPPIYE